MEEILVKMCEDIMVMLSALRQSGKLTEKEFKNHLKKKNEFLQYVRK